jgi:sialate O-acetylesterase
MDKGGPYSITASDKSGAAVCSENIMIGDVVIICGQSNMEFPMIRVKETYPMEWDNAGNDMIRTFKVTENGVFKAPLEDVETGEWIPAAPETLDDYSAVGYFTAKHMRLKEDVCVGVIDLTLGGVIMEAFMSPGMLEGFDSALAEAEKFKDEVYRQAILKSNDENAAKWREDLDKADTGVRDHYENGEQIINQGKQIALPQFFSDTELSGFVGSIWIARRFTVPKEYVKKKATLWFGTITDYDFCYVNGVFIGTTDYCYPPRRYEIPEGILREGENTVVIRICVEKGFGRVTPGKLYGVVFGRGVRTTDGFTEGIDGADHVVGLGGVWNYLIGARCSASEETVFVNWKQTALYNGMMAPLSGLSVKAFAYYQGESNCGAYEEYAALTGRFVEGIRKMWGRDIPYICVQLPEFDARMEEVSYDHGRGWRGLQAAQEECVKIPGCYLVKAFGCGELNDIHPQRKEPIGKDIADIIMAL